MLMQQNRDSTSMDRRKADLSEPGLNDIKSTGNVGQDFIRVLNKLRESGKLSKRDNPNPSIVEI
jgi:hypothetical protein